MQRKLHAKKSFALQALKETAEMLKIHELSEYLDFWSKRDVKQMNDLKKSYRQVFHAIYWAVLILCLFRYVQI